MDGNLICSWIPKVLYWQQPQLCFRCPLWLPKETQPLVDIPAGSADLPQCQTRGFYVLLFLVSRVLYQLSCPLGKSPRRNVPYDLWEAGSCRRPQPYLVGDQVLFKGQSPWWCPNSGGRGRLEEPPHPPVKPREPSWRSIPQTNNQNTLHSNHLCWLPITERLLLLFQGIFDGMTYLIFIRCSSIGPSPFCPRDGHNVNKHFHNSTVT